MSYVLSEEQQFLKDSARDLFKMSPVAKVRELRDGKDAHGYNTALWDQMVEMGHPGLLVSEKGGGLAFGMRALGVVMEESGKSLSASPLLTVAVSAAVIERHGGEAHAALVSQICEKGTIVGIGIQEGGFYNTSKVELTASADGDGFVLSGKKNMIVDGHVADHFLISAKTEEGVTAFLVDASEAGVTKEKAFMMDSRFYTDVSFENVQVAGTAIVGSKGKGNKVVQDITNMTNALLSIELVGMSAEALDRTVAYLKERQQFDKVIGTFQALQHRAADLYGEIEIARSLAIRSLDTLDEDNFMAPAICSMAKAKSVKVAQLATNEGVQMFGGIGMTDDEEIGFFLKRARVASQLFGGRAYHVDRFAKMNGY